MGLDPLIFPEPTRFDPTRFRRGEFGPHGARMSAFGAGPRMCVGVRLAETELLSLLAHVLVRFDVAPAGVPPVEHLAVTNGPSAGLFLRLTARS